MNDLPKTMKALVPMATVTIGWKPPILFPNAGRTTS